MFYGLWREGGAPSTVWQALGLDVSVGWLPSDHLATLLLRQRGGGHLLSSATEVTGLELDLINRVGQEVPPASVHTRGQRSEIRFYLGCCGSFGLWRRFGGGSRPAAGAAGLISDSEAAGRAP